MLNVGSHIEAIIYLAFMFSISILLDMNWEYFKSLAGRVAPAKLLMILRCIQTLSIFALTLLVVNYALNLYLPIDPSMATITASIAGIVLAVTIGTTVYERGAKLSLEETIEEKDLRSRIREDVERVVKDAVYRVGKDTEWLKDQVKDFTGSIAEQVSELIGRTESDLKKFGSKMDQINRIVGGYNLMVKTYREEAAKREALALQIEEVARLEEEYRQKLKELSIPLDKLLPEELTQEKAMLTEADGNASRRKGILAQRETAQILRDLGFELDDYYGMGVPDYVFWRLQKIVGIGAHRAFTLTNERNKKQRTIGGEYDKG